MFQKNYFKDQFRGTEKNNGAFFNNQRIRVSKKNEINECLFVSSGKIKKQLDIESGDAMPFDDFLDDYYR